MSDVLPLSLVRIQGDVILRDAVLEAAEPRLFRAGASAGLVSALGLGSPVGLKLLLDAAEWAERTGDHAHAAACLNAVNWRVPGTPHLDPNAIPPRETPRTLIVFLLLLCALCASAVQPQKE